MIKTTVMGYGTIDPGVAKILDKNRSVITSQAGQEVELKYVLDLRESPDSPMVDKIAYGFRAIRRDEEVKIMMEIIGGLSPAYPFVKAYLIAGKNMVISNKALVTAHGTELLAIARKEHVNFFFEASAGGGTPIIRLFYRCLMGKRIEEITDILNGTTNFTLTKMNKRGGSFGNALKEAQNLGYAERNPEADVEDHDTCHKIVILTAMATGKEVNYEDIYTEGITRITDIDFKRAEKMGIPVKLFGTSRIKGGRVLAYMTPVVIDRTDSLYSVNDIFNGILARGNMLGTSMFHDSDAKKFPTGSAMVADIIEVAQNLKKNVSMDQADKRQAIGSMDQAQLRYFVRTAGSYRNKGQDVKNAFGQVEVIRFYGVDKSTFLTAQMAEDGFRETAISYDSREQEQSGYDIEQTIRAVLQHTASVMSRTIGETVRQGFPYLFHLLTGLYCPGCGDTRAFRVLLAGNLLLSIRHHPLVAYMAMMLTAELVSFAASRATKSPRYYPGYEKLLAYTGAAIVLMNWVYKSYMLVVRGMDLLLL